MYIKFIKTCLNINLYNSTHCQCYYERRDEFFFEVIEVCKQEFTSMSAVCVCVCFVGKKANRLAYEIVRINFLFN